VGLDEGELIGNRQTTETRSREVGGERKEVITRNAKANEP
jgi:hypothetical protein